MKKINVSATLLFSISVPDNCTQEDIDEAISENIKKLGNDINNFNNVEYD